MTQIQAWQHIYSNVEKEQSPHNRGGFQTLFYTQSGLTLRARSGKTCPGRARSFGTASSAMAARMVVARSAAEIPVVTPWRASIDTVKAVPKPELFS